MSLKSYLVLVVGFVIFGRTLQTSAVSNNQEELPQNVITVAIKELIQLLSALGKEAMDEFSKALDQLKSFVNDTLSTIKTEPTKTIEKLVDDIIAAKHKAGKLNVNISKCASDQSIAELKNIPQLYLNQTAECTDSVIQSATEDVNKAKIKLNETIKDVKELLSEGLKCGWNLVCWTSLANKVLKYAISLPREMAALVTNTTSVVNNNQEELSGNVITDTIQDLINRVSALAKEAIDELFKALEELKTIVNETLSAFETESSKIIEKSIGDITAAKDQASKLHVDISKCASDQSIAELKASSKEFLNQLNKCTDSVIHSATEYVNQAKINLDKTINEVEELSKEALTCGSKLACWTNLGSKVLNYIISLPREIAALITQTVTSIYNLGSEISNCNTGYGTKIAAQAIEIATSTTNCISNAIKNRNSTTI